MSESEQGFPLYVVVPGGEAPEWLEACLRYRGSVSMVTDMSEVPSGEAVVLVYAPSGKHPPLGIDDRQVRLLIGPEGVKPPAGFDAAFAVESGEECSQAEGILTLAGRLLRCRSELSQAFARINSLANANREAARIVEEIEERDRRIAEQRRELEERARSLARANAEAGRAMLELEERDRRIREQAEEISRYYQALQQELRLARMLQIGLLPDVQPPNENIFICERFVPATELCGDYYDYIVHPNGDLDVVVADVTGHGVASAMISVQVRALNHIYALQGLEPARILDRINKFMSDNFNRRFLMTMFLLRLAGDSNIVFAGAGHNPFLYARPSGDVDACASQAVPLGVSPDTSHRQEEMEFEPGSRILLYTDGLIEATNPAGEQFGLERLKESLRKGLSDDPRTFVDSLMREVQYFAERTLPFDDDVTVILMERRP